MSTLHDNIYKSFFCNVMTRNSKVVSHIEITHLQTITKINTVIFAYKICIHHVFITKYNCHKA